MRIRTMLVAALFLVASAMFTRSAFARCYWDPEFDYECMCDDGPGTNSSPAPGMCDGGTWPIMT